MRFLDCDQLQLGIVPGPRSTSEVSLSSDSELSEIVQLDPATVAEVLLTIPGISCSSTADPASWDWEAILAASDMTMRIVMTLLESDERGPFWGGFALHGRVSVDELWRVAQELRARLGSIWIHDASCMMRTPDAFREYVES